MKEWLDIADIENPPIDFDEFKPGKFILYYTLKYILNQSNFYFILLYFTLRLFCIISDGLSDPKWNQTLQGWLLLQACRTIPFVQTIREETEPRFSERVTNYI